MAKREAGEALMRRTEKYEKQVEEAEKTGDVNAHIAAKAKVEAIEEFRSFMRNFMLWDHSND